jgi:hypothetical protein
MNKTTLARTAAAGLIGALGIVLAAKVCEKAIEASDQRARELS